MELPKNIKKGEKTMKPTNNGTTKISLEASIRMLMAENKDNLNDPSDKYAQGYQDALKDVLAAMGAEVDDERYD